MASDINTDSSALKNTRSLLSVYDVASGTFEYHKDMLAYFGNSLSGKDLWCFLSEHGIMGESDVASARRAILALNDATCIHFDSYYLGDTKYAFSFVYVNGKITIAIQKFTESIRQTKLDEITGLSRRRDFCLEIEKIVADNRSKDYALFYFDIIKFKAINDLFGFDEGDRLLIYIAKKLRDETLAAVCSCRVSADRFAFLADLSANSIDNIVSSLTNQIKSYGLSFEVSLNIGIYLSPNTSESGNTMLDKAILAQKKIKGSYTNKVNYYNEHLRDEMLSEQEISGAMSTALGDEQFIVYYQPQYNHSTGMIIGAEALVRWQHPEKGLISPALFIPIFEKNGFITRLDLYVFEKVAAFIRRSIDRNYAIVPVSVNFSKHDIFSENFVDNLEKIRNKYNVPSKYLRIEITESILIGNNNAINEILSRLHDCGYIIEMDDFGSGYSSLNVLKDLDVDIIKLDMKFLGTSGLKNRGGTILSSIINMAKWLGLPVIAEGVETVSQADFLNSIGCDCIQGYLYSRPIPEEEYEKLLSGRHVGALIPQMKLIDTLDAVNFWDPTSQETLIFSNFVGAAAIFNYNRKTHSLEIVRVNKKYLSELGMNLSERDLIHGNPIDSLDDENKAIYFDMLERAIKSEEEQECETWRRIRSGCCGEELFCIRSTATVIGKSDNQILFYSMIRNITSEKTQYSSLLDSEKRFKMASEQVNIYFWEYTVATHEMRPCFRCMRDLGLPPLLRNYPDSAIERGIFPPEVADMYRDWHVQVANGVKELEAIIPLTEDRIPFRVRYTTEFDDNGNPVKAYGSAALIVD